MVDFDHLGYDLNHCGGFLDGIQNFIQTCLHHTVGKDDIAHSWKTRALRKGNLLFIEKRSVSECVPTLGNSQNLKITMEIGPLVKNFVGTIY